MALEVTLEWGGGAETLFGNMRQKVVSLNQNDLKTNTLKDLLQWLKDDSGLLTTHKTDLFFSGDTVRPGIIVLVNDSDWELCDQLNYKVQSGDRISFISTLHGG